MVQASPLLPPADTKGPGQTEPKEDLEHIQKETSEDAQNEDPEHTQNAEKKEGPQPVQFLEQTKSHGQKALEQTRADQATHRQQRSQSEVPPDPSGPG